MGAQDLFETMKQTGGQLDLAVLAFTKGQLSKEELWAECDWAATCYERHGVKNARQNVFARYAQVAARFRRTRPERVRPLLNTLAAMSLVRATPEGAYGA